MRRVFCVAAVLLIGLASGAAPALAQSPPAATVGLGTAGGPFGPSISARDLNADGTADLASVDLIGGSPGNRTYQISILIAGHRVRRATFQSSQPTLALRFADVDGDHDPDLLLVVPVSEIPAAVWLNDGQGHFTPADVDRYPHLGTSRHRLGGAAATTQAPTPTSLLDRFFVGRARESVPSPSEATPVEASSGVSASTDVLSQTAPRGPPVPRA